MGGYISKEKVTINTNSIIKQESQETKENNSPNLGSGISHKGASHKGSQNFGNNYIVYRVGRNRFVVIPRLPR